MKKKVYILLVEHFKKWGVSHVFGIPGKSISPLMLELGNQEITFILGRHETGSGYEASGYALIKKGVGIAIGTSGPGGTNLITSAAQAKEFNLPVLFITGHPSAQETGRALSQESSQFGTDLVKMFEPVTLFSARVDRGDMLPMFLRHALEKAYTGEKGPVHLCIPFDILMEEIDSFYIPLPDHISPVISPDIEKAISLIKAAKNPVLFIGKGAILSEVCHEIRILAEHWNIPVITAPGGKGAFPSNHPLYLGGFGLGGTSLATEQLQSGVDLMIVIGSKLCDMALSGFTTDMYPEKVMHFEYELTFIGKSISVQTDAILGDVKQNLNNLIKLSGATEKNIDLTFVQEVQEVSEEAELPTMISAKTVFKTLRAYLPKESVLFGDAGSHSFFAIQHFDILEPGTFYFDEVFISMGSAIGYSIGAKIGAPDKTIVCVTGDGCVMMFGTEISTAVNNQVGVIFIVLNNGRLDMVDKGMSYNTGRSVGAIYDIPIHVADFAKSMGAHAYRCYTKEEIAESVQKACLQQSGPTVIEIMVDPLEIPPILTRLLSID